VFDAGSAEPEADPIRRPKKRDDKRPKQSDHVEPPPPPPVEPPPPPPPADAPVPRYDAVTTRGRRIEILNERCTAPCVADVTRAYSLKEWAKSEETLEAFLGSLRACWVDVCKLPK
jgi:hypothetical protein